MSSALLIDSSSAVVDVYENASLTLIKRERQPCIVYSIIQLQLCEDVPNSRENLTSHCLFVVVVAVVAGKGGCEGRAGRVAA